jgi:hypothetical protein
MKEVDHVKQMMLLWKANKWWKKNMTDLMRLMGKLLRKTNDKIINETTIQ